MTLGHVHLKVRDLDRAVDFYTRFLGLRVTERLGGQMAFLSSDVRHHTIALQALGRTAPGPSHGVGLYHVAFEVADRAALAAAFVMLEAGGITPHAVDHGISWALYFPDPDGNGLEVYCDTRAAGPDRDAWHGRTRSLAPERLRALASETLASD